MKLLKFALVPLACAALVPFSAQAHETQPAVAATSTLLSISADYRTTRAPDLALFNAGVTSQGKTASEALAANSADMNRVILALRKAGIADRDIQTSSLSLNPVYGQPVIGPNGQVVQEARIVGYQASNTVMIRHRDLKETGRVLDSLVAAGANNISGPNFQIENTDALLDEARTGAMKKARARADLYARAAGLRVVRIVAISEGGGFSPPAPMLYAKAAMALDAAPTPIAAGELEMSVTVSVQFELAP